MPADHNGRAGLLGVRDRRELQLIAPAVHIRQQAARRFRKRNNGNIRGAPVWIPNDETAFSKTSGWLLLPAAWRLPPNDRACVACRRDLVGHLRFRFLRDAINRDLRIVLAADRGKKNGAHTNRKPAPNLAMIRD